jgi:hypothetical protein
MTEKKGWMTQYPCARGRKFVCKNIGDYVQSVATRQFIDHIDEYVEQEEADQYFPEDRKPIRLVMNGWFQWRAENWPPSKYIKPLLISMHISPLRAEQILSPQGIEFLKKNSPVGCRDTGTLELLRKNDIPAYYSACLTLTLGRKYLVAKSEREGVYFVDPYFDISKPRFWKLPYYFLYAVFHMKTIINLGHRHFFKEYSPIGFLDRSTSRFRPYYKALLFFKTYSKKFSKKMLLNATYITHWLDVDMAKDTNDDLLDIAESLVKKYAAAKMVITSRIHAGLPCLGLQTPVIFIANKEVVSENSTFNTPGRLGGLLDFFRIIVLVDGEFTTDDKVLSNIDFFNEETVFDNKDSWKPYAVDLSRKVETFMK